MPRAATTSDVFNAIAEPRRRRIIDLLSRDHIPRGAPADRGWHVGALVRELRLSQPTVSKHLGVLRRVRIVSVARRGRSRIYRLNAMELKPVHDWVKHFERFWSHQIDRIRARAEQQARERIHPPHKPHQED